MIYVLIVTSILLMLGQMTIAISQINYKMKQVNSQGKKNFYVVEALVEESDMKLYDYVEQALDYSYGIILVDQNGLYQGDEISSELTYAEINQLFKSTYKKEIKKLKHKLEDINSYNIKTIEGYRVMVEVELKEYAKEKMFTLSIISNYEDKKVIERIETQYNIGIPEYMEYSDYNQIVRKMGWKNYKW